MRTHQLMGYIEIMWFLKALDPVDFDYVEQKVSSLLNAVPQISVNIGSEILFDWLNMTGSPLSHLIKPI